MRTNHSLGIFTAILLRASAHALGALKSCALAAVAFSLLTGCENPLGGSESGTTIDPGFHPGYVQSAPVSTSGTLTTNKNVAASSSLIASDADGDTLRFSLVTRPSHGTVTLIDPVSGAYTYTPKTDFSGTDSFEFKANDGSNDSNVASISVTVLNPGSAPVASNVTATSVAEDAQSADITLSYSDPDGELATSCQVSALNHVSVTRSCRCDTAGACTVRVTGASNYNGAASFSYQVTAGSDVSNTALVSLTITPVNDAPVATNQSGTTALNTPVSITLAGSDADGDTLTYSVVSSPSHGSLSGTAPNLTYTPTMGYLGNDSFTYKTNDGTTDSNTATVSIHVNTPNTAPVATAQSITVSEDVAYVADGTTYARLSGTDADGDSLTCAKTSNPAHGTVTVNSNCSFTYAPSSNYNGADSFTFTVNDGTSTSSPETVSITVNAVNDAPVAAAQTASTNEDTAKSITLSATDVEGDSLTYAVVASPSHGTLSGTAPNLTYTPAANYNGSDSFTFKANDGTSDSNTATISITVTAVNDAPVATAQSVTTNEDTAKSITLAGTDTEGSALTYTVVAGPAHGTLSGTAPNLTYTPATNYNGSDSFTFKVNDGSVDSAANATVSITVTAVNDAPVSSAQSVSTSEDTAKAITLSATDVEGDTLAYSVVANPSHGTLSGTAPNLTYTPAADYNGSDSFTFKANDGTSDSNTATVSITVTAVNDAPAASAQSVTTNEDTAKSITLSATDVDGNSLTYTVVTNPAHGTLSGTAPNLTYTPASNYNGSDSFTFKANDGTADSNTATVSITVNAVNDAPVANAQSVSTAVDVPLSITLSGSDIEGDSLTFSVVANPSHGTLSGTAPNLTYTPSSGYIGSDSFTFKANDGAANSANATVTIDVGGLNTAPVASALSPSTNEDTAKAVTLSATDADSDPLTYVVVTNPSHGTLSGTAPNLTYTPASNYFGADSFTYKAYDGTVDSNVATVSITVVSVDDAPVASAQSVSTSEDTAKAITLAATDTEGDSLTYAVVSGPSHGTLSGTAPNLTYTPAANYNGSDSFTFKANDGTTDSSVATVSITITAVNDAPVATDQSVTTNEDTATSITLSGTDVEGSSLSYTVLTNPTHGTLTGTAPNLTYTPAANYNGSDSFTFKVNDGSVDSATNGTISITVNAVDDAPVASGQSVSTAEDTAKAITLSATDTEGDALTYSVVASPSHGTLSGTAPNLTYTPASNYNGSDSFTFKANDGSSDSNTATIAITVTAVNDAPVASDQSVTTSEDTAKPITLTGSDVEGSSITYTVVTNPAHGTLSGTAPNLTYTPTANFNGTDSFTFKTNDGSVDSATNGTISITVTAVNDAPVASAQSVSTNEDTAKAITLSGTDTEGDTLTYTIVSSPSHGALSGTAPNLTYTPAADYNGSDSFTFKVNDGALDSVSNATVSITVVAVDDAPVATAQSVSTNEDTAKAITLAGTDVESDSLTFTVVTNPSHGTLSGTAPNLTYTPAANYNGADSFTFKANDGTMDSAADATVSITVVAVNDAPVATAQSVTTNEDTAKAITLAGSDVDGDTLAYTVVTSPAHGALSGTAPNLTYTPAADYNGSDSFTFKVNDGTVDSSASTVSITVTAVNDAPVASPQSLSVRENRSRAITLAATDAEGDTLTYSIVGSPSHGTLSGTAPNVTYTPTSAYSGADSFTFKANDGALDSTTATISITVATNNAPVASGQTVNVSFNTAKSFALSGATDPDGDSITYSVLTNPLHGTLSGTVPNLTYTPTSGYAGRDSFTYQAADDQKKSSNGTVTLIIAGDLADDDGTNAGFGSGTSGGAAWSSTKLVLSSSGGCDGTATNCSTLDSSWAPDWSHLITYWKMDNNWNDSIGSNNGTASGDAAFTSAAKVGSYAGTFDGTGDYVDVGDMSSLEGVSTFTYSLWLKPNALATNKGILSKYSSTTNSLDLCLGSTTGTAIFMRVGNGGNTYANTQANTIAAGNWYHVMVVFDGSQSTNATRLKVYLNGVQQTLSFTGTIPATTPANTTNMTIGHYYNGANNYDLNGTIDDVAIWSTALNDTQIQTIYSRQSAKYGGNYASRVLDYGGKVNWSKLGWTSSLPYLKDLPDAACSSGTCTHSNYESTTSYSSIDDNGLTNKLMNGLIGLWHLNGTVGTIADGATIKDDSGNGSDGTIVDSDATNTIQYIGGKVGQGIKFDGANDYIDLGSHSVLRPSLPITIAGWINLSAIGAGTIWSNDEYDSTKYCGINLSLNSTSNLWAELGSCTGGNSTTYRRTKYSTTALAANTWYHVAAVIRDVTDMDLYINGVNDGGTYEGSGGAMAYLATPKNARIGTAGNTVSSAFGGILDELAIWNRGLSAAEISQLYLRGSARVKYQVRSCATSPCTTETWKGPDGTNQTYFSELNNNSVPLDYSGDTYKTSPDLPFSSFTSGPSSNRYFQYRTFLESDDSSSYPDVKSVTVTAGSKVDDAPVAAPIAFTFDEDTNSGTITLSYTDSDDDLATSCTVTATSHITVTNACACSAGVCTVKVIGDADYYGTASFDYTVTANSVTSNTATATLTISSVADQPIASDLSIQTGVNTAYVSDGANYPNLPITDLDGLTQTCAKVTDPSHGTVTVNSNCSFTYTPAAAYTGADSFTFRSNNGSYDSNTATVSITVATNHRPSVSGQSVAVEAGVAKAITLVASDSDGDSLAYTIVASPAHGTLSGTAPNLTYTPASTYTGADVFTFKVNDGTIDSFTATISITVSDTAAPVITVPANRVFPIGSASPPLIQHQTYTLTSTAADVSGNSSSFSSCTYETVGLSVLDPNYAAAGTACTSLPSLTVASTGESYSTATFTTTSGATATGALKWRPTDRQRGTYKFTVTAGDTVSNSTSASFYVSVRDAYSSTNAIDVLDGVFSDGNSTLGSIAAIPRTSASSNNDRNSWLGGIGSLVGSISSFGTTAPWGGTGEFGSTVSPYRLEFVPGHTDRMTLGSTLNGKTASMFSMWIKPESSSGNHKVIFSNLNGSGKGFALRESTMTANMFQFDVGLTGSTYEEEVLADSPLGYWRLGEPAGSTTFYDRTSHGNNGTGNGAPTAGTTGALSYDSDTAVNFAAASVQRITVLEDASGTFHSPTTKLTLEAWVNVTSFTSTANAARRILATTQTGGYALSFNGGTAGNGCSANSLCLQVYVGGAYRGVSYANTNFSTGTWYHIAATYDGAAGGTGMTLYVNGSSVANAAQTGALAYTNSGGTYYPLCISGDPSATNACATGSYYFNGTIDEPAVYGTALSSTRIAAHYAARNQATCRTKSTLSDSSWAMITGVADSTSAKLYVNGSQDCSITLPSASTHDSTAITVGGYSDGSKAWSGSISQLATYGTSDGTSVASDVSVKTLFNSTANRYRQTQYDYIIPSDTQGLHLDPARANSSGGAYANGCAGTDLDYKDISGANETATLIGYSTCDATSGWNGAGTAASPYVLSMEGTNNYVYAPIATDPTEYTFAAWIKPSAVITRTIFVRSNSSGPGTVWSHTLYLGSTGKLTNYMYLTSGATKAIAGSTVFTTGKWYHVAVTVKNGGMMRVFVNGAEEGTAVSMAGVSMWQAGDNYFIGRKSGQANNSFVGDMGSILYYTRELTPTEINGLCQAEQANYGTVVCSSTVP